MNEPTMHKTMILLTSLGLLGLQSVDSFRALIASTSGIYIFDVPMQSGFFVNNIYVDEGGQHTISPDGQRIAFVANGLFVYELETNRLIRLTEGTSANAGFPIWSNDGQQIAFTYGEHIALADINSSTIQQLTEGTIIRDWSADNNRILFQRAGDIWEYIISENRQINLTAHASVDFGAQWSPDEEYISFISERDGNRELYLLNIQEGSTQRITTTENLAESTDVYWSPDGNWVAFRQWAINPIPGITLYNLQTMAFYDIHISGWGNNWRWVPNSQGLVTIVNDVSAGFPYQYGLYTLQISCVYAENGCVADDLIRVKGIPTLNDLVLDIVPSPVVETNIKPRG